MIVATAGHIDHGKTALVRALTGVDTDRLPEEKARGISIDLGFAYLPLAQGGLIGFVDVPGHERFIHNMLAGVCGIDTALLVVAADDGVMPQTVEHLQILDLLGVGRGIAAVTKCDRVDGARVAEVEAELRSLLAATALAGCEIVPVSAVTGAGVAQLRVALESAAISRAARRVEGQRFRFAVDRAFTVAGSGSVATGTVFAGEVRAGDRLVTSPGGVPVRVRALQMRGEAVARAQAGERCALNLPGIEVGEIARGDWIVDPALHAPTQRMDVRLRLLAGERPLAHWTPVHLHLGTAEVMARVAIRGSAALAPGASKLVRLVLERPIAALAGDRFILRDSSAARTLGGGAVIDSFPPPARRATEARLAQLAALEAGTPDGALAGLLAIEGLALDCAWFETLFNLRTDAAEALYRSAGAAVLGGERRRVLAHGRVEVLREAVLARLDELHRTDPQSRGIELPALRRRVARWLDDDAFAFVLRGLVEARAIEIEGTLVRRTGHDPTANPADEGLWQRVLPLLVAGGYAPPTVAELAGALGVGEASLRDLLHRKSRSGDPLRVTEERFYPRATVAVLAANAALVARHASGGLFTAAQFRDATGVGRGLAIRILEYLDTLGITQRIGDTRKMHKNFVPILGPAKPALVATPGKSAGRKRTRRRPG